MKAQIEKLIEEYEFEIGQRKKFYYDEEFYLNEGKIDKLQEVVADLKKVLNALD